MRWRHTLAATWTWLELGAALLAWVPILAAVTAVSGGDHRIRGRWLRRLARVTVAASPTRSSCGVVA